MATDRVVTMNEFNSIPNKPDLIKLREEVDKFRAFAGVLKENAKIQAGITKAKYDALVAEGFTPQQALELCRGM